MWLFLFQFVFIALVLGFTAGFTLRAWDKRKPSRDKVLLSKVLEEGFTLGTEVQPGVVSQEFQDKINVLGR
jgi:hypothetical protein